MAIEAKAEMQCSNGPSAAGPFFSPSVLVLQADVVVDNLSNDEASVCVKSCLSPCPGALGSFEELGGLGAFARLRGRASGRVRATGLQISSAFGCVQTRKGV